MEITYSSLTISVSWIVIVFVVVAVAQPRLLPKLIDALRERRGR